MSDQQNSNGSNEQQSLFASAETSPINSRTTSIDSFRSATHRDSKLDLDNNKQELASYDPCIKMIQTSASTNSLSKLASLGDFALNEFQSLPPSIALPTMVHNVQDLEKEHLNSSISSNTSINNTSYSMSSIPQSKTAPNVQQLIQNTVAASMSTTSATGSLNHNNSNSNSNNNIQSCTMAQFSPTKVVDLNTSTGSNLSLIDDILNKTHEKNSSKCVVFPEQQKQQEQTESLVNKNISSTVPLKNVSNILGTSSSSPNPECSPYKLLSQSNSSSSLSHQVQSQSNMIRSPSQQQQQNTLSIARQQQNTLSPNGSTINDAVAIFNAVSTTTTTTTKSNKQENIKKDDLIESLIARKDLDPILSCPNKAAVNNSTNNNNINNSNSSSITSNTKSGLTPSSSVSSNLMSIKENPAGLSPSKSTSALSALVKTMSHSNSIPPIPDSSQEFCHNLNMNLCAAAVVSSLVVDQSSVQHQQPDKPKVEQQKQQKNKTVTVETSKQQEKSQTDIKQKNQLQKQESTGLKTSNSSIKSIHNDLKKVVETNKSNNKENKQHNQKKHHEPSKQQQQHQKDNKDEQKKDSSLTAVQKPKPQRERKSINNRSQNSLQNQSKNNTSSANNSTINSSQCSEKQLNKQHHQQQSQQQKLVNKSNEKSVEHKKKHHQQKTALNQNSKQQQQPKKLKYDKEFLIKIRDERSQFIETVLPDIFKAYCYCMTGKHWDPEKYFDIVQFSGDYDKIKANKYQQQQNRNQNHHHHSHNQHRQQYSNKQYTYNKYNSNNNSMNYMKSSPEVAPLQVPKNSPKYYESQQYNNYQKQQPTNILPEILQPQHQYQQNPDTVLLNLLKKNESQVKQETDIMSLFNKPGTHQKQQIQISSQNILDSLLNSSKEQKAAHQPVVFTAQELELLQFHSQQQQQQQQRRRDDSSFTSSYSSAHSSPVDRQPGTINNAYKQLLNNIYPPQTPSSPIDNVLRKLNQTQQQQQQQQQLNQEVESSCVLKKLLKIDPSSVESQKKMVEQPSNRLMARVMGHKQEEQHHFTNILSKLMPQQQQPDNIMKWFPNNATTNNMASYY